MNKIFFFLKKLKKNNDRHWFKSHKDKYDKAKAEFEDFLKVLIAEIAKFDKSVKNLEPQDTMYRIYRDVRFSKDKLPYKLNFGAAIVAGGRKTGRAGYYVHVQPGKSILAGGIYHPQDDALKGIRRLIDKEGEELKKIVDRPLFKKYFGEIVGDSLKRSPKDYSEDHPYIEFLRQKDFLAVHKLSDSTVSKKDFAKFAAKVFKELKAFDDFFNSVIEIGKR